MDKKLTNDELYVQYERLIHYILKKYKNINNPLFDYDDLYQEACLGMYKAYEKYDPNKGPFITYLYPYIVGYINHYIGNNSSSYSIRKRSKDDTVNEREIRFDECLNDGRGHDTSYSELIGYDDAGFKNMELIYVAKKVARDQREYDMWYEVYVLGRPQVDVAKENKITRSRIGQILTDMNARIGAIYFKDRFENDVKGEIA